MCVDRKIDFSRIYMIKVEFLFLFKINKKAMYFFLIIFMKLFPLTEITKLNIQ